MKLPLTKTLLIFFAGFIFAIPVGYGALLARRAIIDPGPTTPPAMEGFNDPAGREQVKCAEFPAEGTAVILTFGQSNASNDGETLYQPQGPVFNFNFLDGNCYKAIDPLLGATGTGGSIWSRLGELLVSRNKYENVIVAPIAFGGSSIIGWTDPGALQPRIGNAVLGLKQHGLEITHIMWLQGSADSRMPKKIYEAYFDEIADGIRNLEVSAPIYVALETCNKRTEVRDAQMALLSEGRKILAGPDSDAISEPGDRWQGDCHFSDIGLSKHAEAWFTAISENP